MRKEFERIDPCIIDLSAVYSETNIALSINYALIKKLWKTKSMAITSQPKNLENENIIKSQKITSFTFIFIYQSKDKWILAMEIITPFCLDLNKSTQLYLTSIPAKKAYNYFLKKCLNCAFKCT